MMIRKKKKKRNKNIIILVNVMIMICRLPVSACSGYSAFKRTLKLSESEKKSASTRTPAAPSKMPAMSIRQCNSGGAAFQVQR